MFRNCSPESVCVELMPSLSLKAVYSWLICLDTTCLSAAAFVMDAASGLSHAIGFSLTIEIFQSGQSVFCTFQKMFSELWNRFIIIEILYMFIVIRLS